MLKSMVKRALASRGWQLTRQPSLNRFLQNRGIDLVIDVGANEGQFAHEIRSMGYQGEILSFEPLPSAFAALSRAAATDDRWTVENCGLGSKEGELPLNVAEFSVFSSFAPLTEQAGAFDARSATVETVSVPVRRLDAFGEQLSNRRAFLKIDTQGFEREVLIGAGGRLQAFLGVQLEMPIVHLYDGVWKIEEALSFMRERGFVPAQIKPVNTLPDDEVSFVEVDCVFRRA